MWFLSTDRAELHFFSAPEAVSGGYAILSHTWIGTEQSFQDTQALRERCQLTGDNPRDLSTPKVRDSCILAQSHGYRWIWNDTCCIDKTSSTELSEAINSMFRWYSCAEVCYAYLEDVPTDCELAAQGSAFRTARWHGRGWTLQELIAPGLVMFVSQDWKVIGNKIELAKLLQEITGVFLNVLTRETHYSVVSVAQRMSWASKRTTTRVEDEAYSMMGLFNVNMPTIYGEGRQAFQRLQQEIIKQSFDSTLFAWGRWTYSDNLTPITSQGIYRYFNTSSQNHVYLLANVPHVFYRPFKGRFLRFTPSATRPLQPYLPYQWKPEHNEPEGSAKRTLGPFGSIELPQMKFTSYGVECRLPVFEAESITIAVLLCDNEEEHIGLLLHPSNWIIQDPSRKKYHVGYGFRTPSGSASFARLVSLGNDFYNLRFNGKTFQAQWRNIFIADSAPPMKRDFPSNLCLPLNCIVPAPPFRVPHWLAGRLTALGMEICSFVMRSHPKDGKPLLAALVFGNIDRTEGIRLTFGMCAESPSANRPQTHWAAALPLYHANWSRAADWTHDCSVHHVDSWPRWSKDFGDDDRTVRLSFSRSQLTPQSTLLLNVELEGRVFTEIKRTANATFPSREELGLVVPPAVPDVPPSTDSDPIPSHSSVEGVGAVNDPEAPEVSLTLVPASSSTPSPASSSTPSMLPSPGPAREPEASCADIPEASSANSLVAAWVRASPV